jgi:hypothetical protein
MATDKAALVATVAAILVTMVFSGMELKQPNFSVRQVRSQMEPIYSVQILTSGTCFFLGVFDYLRTMVFLY